ncbi:hypothetical protein D1872_282580 [compost metagenome]
MFLNEPQRLRSVISFADDPDAQLLPVDRTAQAFANDGLVVHDQHVYLAVLIPKFIVHDAHHRDLLDFLPWEPASEPKSPARKCR